VLDTVIVFAAVATVQWMLLVEPYRHADLGPGARLTSMAYPAMDVLLFVGLAQLMVGVGRKTLAYWLLLMSVGLWIVGDEIFAFAAGSYASGSGTDIFWLGSYVLWGAAALALSRRDHALSFENRGVPRLTTGRLALLALALLAVPVTLTAEQQFREHSHPTAAAVGFVVIAVLVLVRLSGLVRLVEQARLDERQARNDAERARERIEEQNAQLLELDRLKDELLSNVSHELRTPLTSITGYVELLLEETEDPQERRHLEIVQRNTARLLALVSDLLFAALLQSGQLELHLAPVDLRELVDHAADSARPHADAAGVGLRVRADNVPPVEGERDRLAQLLDNLVSNAIKFTPSGGEVEISLNETDGEVVIEVADTGIGLSEDERAQVFGRFYRADSAGRDQIPGTGLGLYIAKAIVDAHGGRIDVKSPPRGGTTFTVELPASSTRPPAQSGVEAAGQPGGRGADAQMDVRYR
jgi:signal transduction histidine kinase